MTDIEERFKRSAETSAALQLLRETVTGTVVSWDAFATATGIELDDTDRLRGVVDRAKKIHERENGGRVFWPIQGVGQKCLSDGEVAELAPSEARKRIRNQARRSKQRLLCVKNFDGLTDGEKAAWNSGMVTALAIEHVASAKATEKVLVSVDGRQKHFESVNGLRAMLGMTEVKEV